MNLKIGFTGTKGGMSIPQQLALSVILDGNLERVVGWQFHDGDCVGADAEAHDIAAQLGYYLVGHPPLDDKLRAWRSYDEIRDPKEYLLRNLDIVKECDILIAAPKSHTETLRSGTWSTVRRARELRVPVILLERGR